MNFTITENTELQNKLFSSLQTLSETQVDIGLLPSAGGRLAFILGVQTHGSPIMHIPPRPVVQPALQQTSVRTAIAEGFAQSLSAAMEGDSAGVTAGLESAGQAGADGIRAYIDAGIAPPNSPVTVSGGWIWNRVAKKGVLITGKGSGKPLYRTGALYNAFDYEVKKR